MTLKKIFSVMSAAIIFFVSSQTFAEEKNSEPEIAEEKNSDPENYVKLAENKLAEILDTQVKIVSDSQTSQIQITFSDDNQLLRIIRNLDRYISAPKDFEITEKISAESKEEKIAALRKFSTSGTL